MEPILKTCPHCSTEGILIMSDGRCPNCKKLLHKDKEKPIDSQNLNIVEDKSNLPTILNVIDGSQSQNISLPEEEGGNKMKESNKNEVEKTDDGIANAKVDKSDKSSSKIMVNA